MAENQFYDEDMTRHQERVAATGDMRAQREVMLDLMNLSPGDNVLDVGSGNGIFAREVCEKIGDTGHICGIDSSEPMIAMSKAICPNGEFLLGDATDFPVQDARFDVVTASQLFCFVQDPDRTVSEMFRALKPGGRAVILDSDWGSLVWNCQNQGLMDRTIKMLMGPYADGHVPRTLSRRLIAAGFEITARQTHTVLNWTFDAESYSQQMAGFLKPMMQASNDFSDNDWETWIADQHATAKAGEYFFSLNRYIFSAVKR